MGRHKVLTDYAKGFILDMYEELSQREIADALGVDHCTVRNFLIREGKIETHNGQATKGRTPKEKEGYFDVYERENWLV